MTLSYEPKYFIRFAPNVKYVKHDKSRTSLKEKEIRIMDDCSIGMDYNVNFRVNSENIHFLKYVKNNFNMFINEIKIGDYAILGLGKTKGKYLVQITSDYYFDNINPNWNYETGYFHRRKFKLIQKLDLDMRSYNIGIKGTVFKI